MRKNVLAFDFGASSGRAILGKYTDGRLELEEVHRFPNEPIVDGDGLYWDVPYLFEQIQIGIKRAVQQGTVDSLGIDTWGVDTGLIDETGTLLQNPRHYRDPRTKGMIEEAYQKMSAQQMYQQTGNQIMEINTLFQLLATKNQEATLFKRAHQILFMPDLFNYLLTGERAAERSIASTGQLVNATTNVWDATVQSTFDLPETLFPPLVDAGHLLGKTKREFEFAPIDVYNVCAHDTASAVVSIPSNQKFLFVSCGTWSLVGTELEAPILNEKAAQYNLTNESGINGTTRFLKNCTGLWIIQEFQRNLAALGRYYEFSELADLAEEASAFQCFIDTDDPLFSEPGDMITRIQDYAKATKQTIPTTDGAIARCIYESLAMKYKYTFLEIIDAVEMEFDTVNIVGGGSKASILCQMVANAANMRVCAGPVEATAIGNIAVQLKAQGVFDTLSEVREWVKTIADTSYYYPDETSREWDRQFSIYQKIINHK